VDNSITAKELKKNIVQQNLEDDLLIKEEDIIAKFKIGSKDKPTVHWTI